MLGWCSKLDTERCIITCKYHLHSQQLHSYIHCGLFQAQIVHSVNMVNPHICNATSLIPSHSTSKTQVSVVSNFSFYDLLSFKTIVSIHYLLALYQSYHCHLPEWQSCVHLGTLTVILYSLTCCSRIIKVECRPVTATGTNQSGQLLKSGLPGLKHTVGVVPKLWIVARTTGTQ